jgi:cytochrome c556
MLKVLLFVALCCSGTIFANEGTGEKIGKKVDQTVDGVSEFSKEQKEKIQKEFKEQLSALDQEIGEIKAKAKKAKVTATEESKKQMNDQIEFLEKRKSELKADFKNLQNSSGRAWDQIKAGFQESMGTLKESFKKAKQEFQSEEKK